MKIHFGVRENLSSLIVGAEIPMRFPEGISRSDISEKAIQGGDWNLYFQTYTRWMSFGDVNDAHEPNCLGALEHFLKAYSLGQMTNNEVVVPARICAGRCNLYAHFSVGTLYFEQSPMRDFAPGTKFLLIQPCT